MKTSLPLKLLRGFFFLLPPFTAAFSPRMVHGPEPPLPELSLSTIATILALFMQGVIWTNIIISHYIQRSVQLHVTDGSSITTFKALGAVARLVIWIALGLAALSALHIQIRPLLTGLGIGGLSIALPVPNNLCGLLPPLSRVMDNPFLVRAPVSLQNYRGQDQPTGPTTPRERRE